MIEVDGSLMEGGGQILRMAVTYSAVMGVPVKVWNIRAGRSKPGLRPQHLTTLKAVEEICRAKTKGLILDSMEIVFYPGPMGGGSYEFDIGTAGSIGLLLQSVAPIATFSKKPMKIRIKGGTAVRWAPPVRILDNVVWEAFRRMGFDGDLKVERDGFYPRGGGVVEVKINPIDWLRPLEAESQGEIRLVRGFSICGRLPQHVAVRQASSANTIINDAGYAANILIEVPERQPFSPGSVIGLWVESHPWMFMGASSLGERGKPAERVGAEAARSLLVQLDSGASTDRYTADNLVLWCSLAEGKSVYTTSELTAHTETAIELAKMFTKATFDVSGELGNRARISCGGIGMLNKNI